MSDTTECQEIIKGWDQDKVRNTTVGIVGSNALTHFVMGNLIGLNIGGIKIVDLYEHERNSYELWYFDDNNKSYVTNLEEKIKSLVDAFPPTVDTNVQCIPGARIPSQFDSIDILLDLTNDLTWKLKSIKYAKDKHIPLISASTTENVGYVEVLYPLSKKEKVILKKKERSLDLKLAAEFQNLQQGNYTSGIFAGLVVDELRKTLFRLNEYDLPLVQPLTYSNLSEMRFSCNDMIIGSSCDNLSNKKILIAGAGALGNFVALHSALAGIGHIDIVDFDDIEETNLNRQILYFGGIGKYKVNVMKSRLSQINPTASVNAIFGKVSETLSPTEKLKGYTLVDESYVKNQKYDVIFICGDNPEISTIINKVGTKNKIPFIDGNSHPFSGQICIYGGYGYACLNHQSGKDAQSFLRQTRNSQSDRSHRNTGCLAATHAPSVVMSNQIVAALMVAESLAILEPHKYGLPLKYRIRYDSCESERFVLQGPQYPRSYCKYCSDDDVNYITLDNKISRLIGERRQVASHTNSVRGLS